VTSYLEEVKSQGEVTSYELRVTSEEKEKKSEVSWQRSERKSLLLTTNYSLLTKKNQRFFVTSEEEIKIKPFKGFGPLKG